MKQQPTITYIKNGIEQNIKLNIFNYLKIKKQIFIKDYYQFSDNESVTIDEDITFIHFKNIHFNLYKIECLNYDTICILENCTFEKSKNLSTLNLENGSFQVINPKLVGISGINARFTEDFDLTISDEKLSQETEFSIDVYSNNISIQGDFFLSNVVLEGKKVTFGNNLIPTKIRLLEYTWSGLFVETEELELKNCLILNKSEHAGVTLDASKLNIDNQSIIKNKNYTFVKSSFYEKKPKNYRIITEKELVTTSLISVLKAYKNLLNSKIDQKKDKYLQNILSTEKSEIEKQETYLEELRTKLATKEKELEISKEKFKDQTIQIGTQITKQLSKKRTDYFNK